MISTDWPVWSLLDQPEELARYVVPEEVCLYARIPEASAGTSRLNSLRALWDALADRGIGYAPERRGSTEHAQWIRPPAEVLVAPGNGTCLDLALTLAGACEHAGLGCAVIILRGDAGVDHALLAVELDQWPAPARHGTGTVWTVQPDWLTAELTPETDLAGSVVVLDPVQLTTGVGLDEAVARGHAYLDNGRWSWALGAPVPPGDLRRFAPGRKPDVLPLKREAYLELPYPTTDDSALMLFRAEFALTPFQSRAAMTVVEDLADQAVGGGPLTLAVMDGVGGSGKTRLLLELITRLRKNGWYAGLLEEDSSRLGPSGRSLPAESVAWLGQVQAPVMVAIDYADTRVEQTQEVLRVMMERHAPGLVVLTARSREGRWLADITESADPTGSQLRIDPIALDAAHPNTNGIYARTFERLTREAASPVPPTPSGRGWTTLDLVMLAWAEALPNSSHQDAPHTRADLYGRVLNHERRYWSRSYQRVTGRPDTDSDLLDQAATVATLLDVTLPDVETSLTAIPELADDRRWRHDVMKALRACLQSGSDQRLAVRPDPIADHLVLTILARHPNLLLRSASTGPESLAKVVFTLTRASRNDADRAAVLTSALLRANPDQWPIFLDVALAVSGPAVTALEEAAHDPDLSLPWRDIDAAIPITATQLPSVGLHVTRRSLDHASPGMDRANLLLRYSERSRLVGDRAGALTAIDEAVTTYRALAEANPAAFLPDLAASLNNQAAMRSEVGDRAGALTAIDEAVTTYRALAEANLAAFLPDLAMSLNNQANLRSEVGDRAGALTAIDEAVTLRRALAEANPAAFLPNLAASLNNQAAMRSEVGDRAGALTAIDEAVTTYRTLAEANPAAFLPNLAASLNNQANLRSEVGDRAGALTAIDEAVTTYRALAEANPAAFLPDLAMSLNNQANLRSEVGDRAGALTAIDEAVTTYRALAEANPAAFLPDLAASLNNQAAMRSEVGDRAGALTAIDEAVTLRRALAEANPAVFLPDLAASLNNQAAMRSEVGDRAGALTAIDEAVTLRRALAEANPAAFLPDLAASLNNQAAMRSEVGDRAGALTAIDEAVTLRRALAEANPAAFLPDLAASLNNQAAMRSEVGDRAGALTAIDEAVTTYRALAEANLAAFLPDLAMSLNNQANLRSEVGDRAGALTAIDEAVTLRRALAEANPAAFLPDLAASLNNQAAMRSEVGDRAGALTAIDEAVTLRRALAEANPAAFLPDLAASLNNQAAMRSEVGDRAGALTAIDEAVTTYRTLAEANPAAFLPDLAASLNNQANLRSEVGDRAGALTAIDEAVTTYRALAEANPAAFLPDLAMSLNNQANLRSEVGDRAGALTAIDEAVTTYRALAEANPAAFLPDLAASLNNQAAMRSEVGDRAGALTAIDEAVTLRRALAEANPAAFVLDLARATHLRADLAHDISSGTEVWADGAHCLGGHVSLAEYLCRAALWHHDRKVHETAREQLLNAVPLVKGERDAPPFILSRARQAVRTTALMIAAGGVDLPAWCTAHVPEEHLKVVRDWAKSSSIADQLNLLSEVGTPQPELLSTVQVLAFLRPGDNNIIQLQHILTAISEHGPEAVLNELAAHHQSQRLVEDWLATPSRSAALDYLDAHPELMTDFRIPEILAFVDSPVATRHAAILQLSRGREPSEVRNLVLDPHRAADVALTAVTRADLHLAIIVLGANPDALSVPGGGPLLQAVLLTMGGEPEPGVGVIRQMRGSLDETTKRAFTIVLAKLERCMTTLEKPPVPVTDIQLLKDALAGK